MECKYCKLEFDIGDEVVWAEKGMASLSDKSGELTFEGTERTQGPYHPQCLLESLREDGYDWSSH